MDLKGTRTEKNLLAAFSGESMARNKYLFFADKARQEGEEEVAQLFEMMARNEGVHGKLLYQSMKQVGTSSENLQEAMEGEYGEWSSMYPAFAQVAREEGFSHIGTLFDEIAKIEKDHEFRFLGALAKLKAKNKAAAPAPVEPAESKMISVAGYRCQFCGATYEKAPDVCHVCQALGSFEPTTIQKRAEG